MNLAKKNEIRQLKLKEKKVLDENENWLKVQVPKNLKLALKQLTKNMGISLNTHLKLLLAAPKQDIKAFSLDNNNKASISFVLSKIEIEKIEELAKDLNLSKNIFTAQLLNATNFNALNVEKIEGKDFIVLTKLTKDEIDKYKQHVKDLNINMSAVFKNYVNFKIDNLKLFNFDKKQKLYDLQLNISVAVYNTIASKAEKFKMTKSDLIRNIILSIINK